MLTTKMIGNKIAEARKKINISQAQLAQRPIHQLAGSRKVGARRNQCLTSLL